MTIEAKTSEISSASFNNLFVFFKSNPSRNKQIHYLVSFADFKAIS
jgi:hypothetical protein